MVKVLAFFIAVKNNIKMLFCGFPRMTLCFFVFRMILYHIHIAFPMEIQVLQTVSSFGVIISVFHIILCQ